MSMDSQTKQGIVDFLRASSFLFSGFKNATVTTHTSSQDDENWYTYSKKVSPLFSEDIMNGSEESTVLSIILRKIPYYHLESNTYYADYRDPGTADVPRSLQTLFWKSFTQDAEGSIANEGIRNVYNKLRYTWINENQILNNKLFISLADTLSDEDGEPYLSFRGTEEINDIVDKRLSAIYALLNYSPSYAHFVDSWIESEINSGRLSSEEGEDERELFKVQDVQYELLRRKFAGSTALYKIAVHAINRRGAYILTAPVRSLNTSLSDTSFQDDRLVRVPYLPGITSNILDLSYMNFDPLAVLENRIPRNIIVPLYYSSTSAQILDGSLQSNRYTAYTQGTQVSSSSGSRGFYDSLLSRNTYMRYNTPIIEWDNLQASFDSSASIETYLKLDENHFMDSQISSENSDPVQLDYASSLFNLISSHEAIYDLSGDTILYHRNSLQKEMGVNYPYVTYPISGGASLSLIDSPWIDYIIYTTQDKSKVQDKILYGAQISKYQDLTGNYAEERFFVLTYARSSDAPLAKQDSNTGKYYLDEETQHTPYQEGDTHCFLYYCKLDYRYGDFQNKRIEYRLISKIRIKKSDQDSDYSEIARTEPSYELMRDYSVGLLPFTYKNLTHTEISDLNIFMNTNAEVEASQGLLKSYQNDFADDNYALAIFKFSDDDIAPAFTSYQTSNLDSYLYIWKDIPSKYTSTIIYGIRRTSDSSSRTEDIVQADVGASSTGTDVEASESFAWSSGIHVYGIDLLLAQLNTNEPGESISEETYHPDWMNMVYQLNPYLNFTKESASPLRYRPVRMRALRRPYSTLAAEVPPNIEALIGPSEFAGLCNLAIERNSSYKANDDGVAYGSSAYKGGSYLRKCRDASLNSSNEYISIWGDNRPCNPQYNEDGTLSLATAADEVDTESCAGVGYPKSSYGYDPLDPASLESSSGSIVKIGPFSNIWDEASVRSVIHHDDRLMKLLDENGYEYIAKGIPCLAITPSTAFTVETVNTENKLSYLDIAPQRESRQKTYSWNDWCWMKYQGGITLCMNILPLLSYEDPNNQGSYKSYFKDLGAKSYYLLDRTSEDGSQGEFSLYLTQKDDDTYTFTFQVYPSGLIKDVWKASLDIPAEQLNANVRVTASYKSESRASNESVSYQTLVVGPYAHVTVFRKITLSDTDDSLCNWAEYQDRTFSTETGASGSFSLATLKTGNYAEIGQLFKGSEGGKLGPISVGHNNFKHYFLGNIYDLRIYNRGADPCEAQLLNGGTTREQYSYSPSIYKLANAVYEGGVVRKWNPGLGASTDVAIDTLRVFNRGVWDSILVDMYPVSDEEQLVSSPQYSKTYYDPYNDPDIYAYVVASASSGNLPRDLSKGVISFIGNEGKNSQYTTEILVQKLKGNYEAFKGQKPISDTVLSYNGTAHILNSSDNLNVVMTTIYPINYSNKAFDSGIKFASADGVYSTASGGGTESIKLPAVPAGDASSLVYRADFDINFKMKDTTDWTSYYSRGDNIQVIYDKDLEGFTLTHINNMNDASLKSAIHNHVVVPLYIPKQTHSFEGSDSSYLTLKALSLHPIKLSAGISSLLDARNYYTELRVPVAINKDDNTLGYISRWDAIRTFREGEYYLTCKYPMQILPLLSNDTSTEGHKYATVYATVRFKIVVSGTPHENTEAEIAGYPASYRASTIVNTLQSSSSLYSPVDNRTFPHRYINIDLYSLDTADDASTVTGYSWKLLASNHLASADDYYKNGIIKLDAAALKGEIALQSEVYAFFTKCYTSPFFVAPDTDSNSFTAADDVVVYKISNQASSFYPEQLLATASSSDDKSVNTLENLVLHTNKTYRLLFDYTGNITEYSYSADIHTQIQYDSSKNLSLEYAVDANEQKSYSRLTSYITDSNNERTAARRDMMYTSTYNWTSHTTDSVLTGINTNSGYTIKGDVFTDVQVDESASKEAEMGTSVVQADLGDPYSKSSLHNYVLAAFSDSPARYEITNTFAFTYKADEYESHAISAKWYSADTVRYKKIKWMALDSSSSTDRLKGKTLPVINDNNSLSNITNFDEYSILVSHYKNLSATVESRIAAMRASHSGAIARLSHFTPIFGAASGPYASNNKEQVLTVDDYELSYYYANNKVLPLRNDFTVSCNGLYGNNLVQTQDFSGLVSGYWVADGTYEPLEAEYDGEGHLLHEAKDAFFMPVTKNETVRYMKYAPSSAQSFLSFLEAAITVKPVGCDVKVDVIYYKGNEETYDSTDHENTVTSTDTSTRTEAYTYYDSNAFVRDSEGNLIPVTANPIPKGSSWVVWSHDTASEVLANRFALRFTISGFDDGASVHGIYVNKAVVRRKKSFSHISGLSDVIYSGEVNTLNANTLSLMNMATIVFKNKDASSVFPIQFKNIYAANGAIVAFSTAMRNLIDTYVIDDLYTKKSDTANSAVTYTYGFHKMLRPWTRAFVYKKAFESMGLGAQFYKYYLSKNNMGVYEKHIDYLAANDIFLVNNAKPVAAGTSTTVNTAENTVTYSANSNAIVIQGLKLNLDDEMFAAYPSNISPANTTESVQTLSVSNERFSMLSTCMYPDRYKQGKNTSIAITNMQVMDSASPAKIMYEVEFLPIIYNEFNQHISINLMFKEELEGL